MKRSPLRRFAAAWPALTTHAGRAGAWLAGPLVPQSAGVRTRLHALSFDLKTYIVFGSVSVSMIGGTALLLTDAAWPYAWLAAELLLLAARLLLIRAGERAAARGEAGPVGALLALGTLWAVIYGLGCAACLATGETVLAVLAGLNVAATVATVATRDAGTPRVAAIIMLAVAVPFAVGALLSPVPAMAIVGVQAPIHVFGMLVLLRKNHRGLVRMFQAEMHNRQLARLDTLTGLANRAALSELLAGLCERVAGRPDERFAVLSLDLDGFKTVNDQHGHGAGDRLLALVADRLRRAVRDGDTACRIGGDEFVIVLPGAGEAEARQVADRVIDAVSQDYMLLDGTRVRVGVSVGSALAPEHGISVAALLARSDQALYLAKRTGRGRHVLAAG